MDIRIYRQGDLEQVRLLWQKQLSNSSPYNDPEKSIAQKCAFQPQLFFVGQLQTRIIATTMGGYDGHRGWLYNVAVADDCQKKGYGKAIVSHAVNALKNLGCRKINLQIRADNHEVESFYRHLGFEAEPRISMGIVLA